MGLTNFNEDHLKGLIPRHGIKSVIELGAQNIYTNAMNGRWASEWYKTQGITTYACIDVNEANGAIYHDLSTPVSDDLPEYDLVTDFGTSEHVAGLYGCWSNKFELCRVGGLIYSENPMTGNWPGHGRHYLESTFYPALARLTGLELRGHGTHAAMHNYTDGWNVWGILLKTPKSQWITRAAFASLPVRDC